MNRPTDVAALIAAYREDWRLFHRDLRSLEGLDLFVRAFGPMPIGTLNAAHLERWRRARRREGIAVATLRRNLAALSGACEFAIRQGWLPANPVRALERLPELDEPRVRFLSAEEERRLRAALAARDVRRARARASGNARQRARGAVPRPTIDPEGYADYLTPAVLLTLNTGLRQGELLALRWGDVQTAHLSIRAVHAKSRRARHLPLNTEARAVLERWRAVHPGGATVFVSRRGAPLRKIRRSWQTVLAEAAIEDFRWHDLRHHFASRLVMAGVPLNTVRELLGHSSLAMTLRYAHLGADHLQAAVARLDAFGAIDAIDD